jgi:enterobactin synthetase component D
MAHGLLAAVHIPDAPDPVSEDVLARLPVEESDYARTLAGYRQVQFVGGRFAARQAASQLRIELPPMLSNTRGAPLAPDELCISISHKRTLAMAMVCLKGPFQLGVDLETYGPPRLGIAKKVLTATELAENNTIKEESRRWIDLLLRFSIKESIYKALDPYVNRYVGFEEAQVRPDLEGTAAVVLTLKHNEGPFWVDARYGWLHGQLITSVRLGQSVTSIL